MKHRQLMKFDPAYGTKLPYPSHPDQYRDYHGEIAWLYNPYTGETRNPMNIGTDVFGVAIIEPGAPIYAAEVNSVITKVK